MPDLDNPPADNITDASPDEIPSDATDDDGYELLEIIRHEGPREFSPFEEQVLDAAGISIETASTYPERFDGYDIRELIKCNVPPETATLYVIEFSGYDIAAFITRGIPPEKANPFRRIELDAEDCIILIDAEIEPDVAAQYVQLTRFRSGTSIALFVKNHVPADAVATYPERFNDLAIVALYQIGVDGETAAKLPEDINYSTVIDACENGVNVLDLIKYPGLIELANAPDVPVSAPAPPAPPAEAQPPEPIPTAAAPEPETPPPPTSVEIPIMWPPSVAAPPPETAPEVPPADDTPPGPSPIIGVRGESDVLFTVDSFSAEQQRRAAGEDILSKFAAAEETTRRNRPGAPLLPSLKVHQLSEILLPISSAKNPNALRRFFNNRLLLAVALAAGILAGGTAVVTRSFNNRTRTPDVERLEPKQITRGCVIIEATHNMIQVGCLSLPTASIPPGKSATLPDTILTGEKNGDKFGVTVKFRIGDRTFRSMRTLFIGIGDTGDLGAVNFEEVQ